MDHIGNSLDTQHPLVEELVDYCAGRLAAHREAELELHLGFCDDCAKSCLRVRVLSGLLSGWSAAGHRRAAAEARVIRALERAQAAPVCAHWQERLSKWAGWVGRSEAALRLVLSVTGDAVRSSVSGWAELTRTGALWQEFAPEAALSGALATRGAGEDTDSVVSLSKDAPQLRVSARTADNRIEVQIEGLLDKPPPLAMLVPDDPGGRILLAELRPAQEPSHLAAVFEQVAVGDYVLVVEPLAEI